MNVTIKIQMRKEGAYVSSRWSGFQLSVVNQSKIIKIKVINLTNKSKPRQSSEPIRTQSE